MIERICPRCRVPMNGDKCVKPNCGCATKMSSTIYWCENCNVPIYEKFCPKCGSQHRGAFVLVEQGCRIFLDRRMEGFCVRGFEKDSFLMK